MHAPHKIPIQSIDHKSIDHLIELNSFICICLQGHRDLITTEFHPSSTHFPCKIKKTIIFLQTLVTRDANNMARALRNLEE